MVGITATHTIEIASLNAGESLYRHAARILGVSWHIPSVTHGTLVSAQVERYKGMTRSQILGSETDMGQQTSKRRLMGRVGELGLRGATHLA